MDELQANQKSFQKEKCGSLILQRIPATLTSVKSVFFYFLVILVFSSCATHPSRVSPIQKQLLNGNCSAAKEVLKDLSSKEGDDRLLYLMEYGSTLQICKEYAESNQIFLEADKLSEQIDYISASRVLGATLLNEEMIQYKGDVFEKLFINVSAALNYIELGQFDEAMVEVRRINEKYNKFSAEEKNSYELNSFSQYLSGLLWELDKKYDDACIAYKESYKLDRSYRNVGIDMLSACWRAKRYQEFDLMLKELNPTEEELRYIKRKNNNEKIIIYLQGLGPKKAPRPDAHLYPYLVPTRNLTKKIKITYQSEVNKNSLSESKISNMVYSVEKAAIATQEADYSALGARRFGARVAKEVTADQIRQKNKTLGDVAWLVMVASERADLRNWTLLPETVQIIRFNPLKNSVVKINGLGNLDEDTESLADLDLSLQPSKKIFLVRTIK